MICGPVWYGVESRWEIYYFLLRKEDEVRRTNTKQQHEAAREQTLQSIFAFEFARYLVVFQIAATPEIEWCSSNSTAAFSI